MLRVVSMTSFPSAGIGGAAVTVKRNPLVSTSNDSVSLTGGKTDTGTRLPRVPVSGRIALLMVCPDLCAEVLAFLAGGHGLGHAGKQQ